MNEEVFNLKGIKFCLCILSHSPYMPTVTALSYIESIRDLTANGIHISLISELFNSIVDSARNNVANEFYTFEEADKLLFIDSDMTWTSEDLVRLMAWSTKYPIVGAMYVTKTDGNHKFLGRYFFEDGYVKQNNYGLIRMEAIPTGFCIIDRSVFEKMIPHTEKYVDNGEEKYRFFKTTTEEGNFIGEDVYFFNRWTKEFNGEIWIDPEINPGHVGMKIYRGNLKQALHGPTND